jgi:hypothetical protein
MSIIITTGPGYFEHIQAVSYKLFHFLLHLRGELLGVYSTVVLSHNF